MWILTGCYENVPPKHWQRKIQLASSRIQLALLEKPLAQIPTQQNEITIAFRGRWICQLLKPGSSVVPKSNQKHFWFSMDCISSGFPSLCIKRHKKVFKLSRQLKATFPKYSYKPSKKNQKKTPQVPLEVCADACQIRMAWKEERKHAFSWSKANFHFTPCWLWLNDQQQVFIGRLKCDWQMACPTTFQFCLRFPNAAGTDG